MKTAAKQIDKSGWGAGPWQSEPDRIEWEHAGLPCLVLRGPHGSFCGYAAVPPSHPYHGNLYDDVKRADGEYIEVHRGLTYGNKCAGEICHVPKPGEPDDVFWFGFDCAHAGDFSPAYDNKYLSRGQKPYNHEEALRLHAISWSAADVYRDLAYVQAETNRLAEQLAEVSR